MASSLPNIEEQIEMCMQEELVPGGPRQGQNSLMIPGEDPQNVLWLRPMHTDLCLHTRVCVYVGESVTLRCMHVCICMHCCHVHVCVWALGYLFSGSTGVEKKKGCEKFAVQVGGGWEKHLCFLSLPLISASTGSTAIRFGDCL